VAQLHGVVVWGRPPSIRVHEPGVLWWAAASELASVGSTGFPGRECSGADEIKKHLHLRRRFLFVAALVRLQCGLHYLRDAVVTRVAHVVVLHLAPAGQVVQISVQADCVGFAGRTGAPHLGVCVVKSPESRDPH
jgi:hypothetical protein